MTKYIRPDLSVIWAQDALPSNIVAPDNAKLAQGWLAEIPPHEYENFLQRRQDEGIAYILQAGVSGWSATQNYFAANPRSYVQGSDGKIYAAIQDNIGHDPVNDSAGLYWNTPFQERNSEYAVSGGVANAYTVTYVPPMNAAAEATVLRFKVVATNTGPSTLSVDGTVAPIIGLGLFPLQGSELVAGGIATVTKVGTNWVLLYSTGGALQVAEPKSSHHAITRQSLQNSITMYYMGQF